MFENSFPSTPPRKKIAILGDALVVPAGTEKVTLFLSDLFPDAPIYTSAYLPENTFPEFKKKNVITLPFGSRVRSERQFKSLFPWWYLSFSLLDLKGFDTVISSASYLAKYINPPRGTTHICCLQNPFRLLWKPSEYTTQSLPFGRAAKLALGMILPLLRRIDVAKTRKIDHVIANSRNMANKFRQIYAIEPDVIYPPIDIGQFSVSQAPQEYYLYAGRLISHKRADLAIQACIQLDRKLIVAGEGMERPALEKIAGRTVEFVGRVTDERLKQLYSNCKALLFPSDEDFGIVPVEVQASGRPVIAFRSGGALETVVEGETGHFFDSQSVESLRDAILAFEKMDFDPGRIRENALRFDRTNFESQIRAVVEKVGQES